MKKYIIPFFILTLFLTGCTNNNPTTEPVPSENIEEVKQIEFPEFKYISNLEDYLIEDFNELNKKYYNSSADNFILTNADTGEVTRISEIEGLKIIELYSGYCDICVKSSREINDFIEYNENISYFMTAKEKNSKEIGIMREAGFNQNLYFFDGDLEPIIGNVFETSRPAYILINEENKVILITGGSLTSERYEEVFYPFKDNFVNPADIRTIEEQGGYLNDGVCPVC